MRKPKDKVKDGDDRVRATMEMILRDYVPQSSEPLTLPAEAPGVETSPVRSIAAPGQAAAIDDVVRARRWF
jgi:hypothetical protein